MGWHTLGVVKLYAPLQIILVFSSGTRKDSIAWAYRGLMGVIYYDKWAKEGIIVPEFRADMNGELAISLHSLPQHVCIPKHSGELLIEFSVMVLDGWEFSEYGSWTVFIVVWRRRD